MSEERSIDRLMVSLTQMTKLLFHSPLPHHFEKVCEALTCAQKKLFPWLQKHAVICHGDLHKNNVLIEKDTKRPFFLDFDFAGLGHPFFDIAKYSQPYETKTQITLLKRYLGHPPSKEEKAHFRIMKQCLLVQTIVNSFLHAQSTEETSTSHFSKKELEDFLDSKDPIPDPGTIAPTHTPPKNWQLQALKALQVLCSYPQFR